MNTFYFSATKGKKEDSTLFKNFSNYNSFFFKEDNSDSLPKVYNKAIDFALQEKFDYLVLCHDDVILESNIEYKLPPLMKKYDVVGVAGASQCTLQQPALWHIMGGGLGSSTLHGAVAHGTENIKTMTYFGVYPHRAIILDGVFLCISRKVFEKVRFDESNPSKWHFYDIDFSLSCYKEKFKLGVSDIMITHYSPGLREFTNEFYLGEQWLINKWQGVLV